MMKKLSKIALLAAATAFLLAAFPACEHENKDEDEKPTVENPSGGDDSSPDNPTEDDEADKDKDDKSDNLPITVFDGSTMSALTDLPSSVTRIDTNGKQAVDSNNKSLNGKSFTSRFKFGGKDTETHEANALKISTGTTSAVKIIVYAMCSNSSNEGSVMAAGSGAAVTLLKNGGSALAASDEISVTPDSDGNIYIWAADNAMNVYYLHISQ